ncbi:hypothetical protein AWB68_08595 [Caballeronia choica]|uniref:Uncharacterized protein n=1 Tax=Caballeronia choica TaxID=326476 RepID=A0A158L3N0_9BURK|nr:hypothetical protein AWB68_08595 [Caballeronia choica]
MPCVVLPATALPLDLAAIEVAIDVRGPVHVDVDVAAAPIAVAEDRTGSSEPDAPGDACRKGCAGVVTGVVSGIRRPIGWRIGRIAPSAIDDRRVVGWHIDHFRVRRLDAHNRGLAGRRRGLDYDLLLLVRFQVARVLRACPQPLHSSEDLFLLRKKSVSEPLRPVELVTHRLEYLRECHQRFHAGVPRLILYRLHGGIALHAGIRFYPARRVHDLQRIGRRHQHLRQHGVRVERDRSDQGLEFLRREWRRVRALCGALCGRLRRSLRGGLCGSLCWRLCGALYGAFRTMLRTSLNDHWRNQPQKNCFCPSFLPVSHGPSLRQFVDAENDALAKVT